MHIIFISYSYHIHIIFTLYPLSILVFPSFDLSDQISFIDARMYPQGYIIAESSGNMQHNATSNNTNSLRVEEKIASLQLHNLLITSTINLHIDYVDMDSSGRDYFIIYSMGQTETVGYSEPTQTKILSTLELLRDNHRIISSNSTLTFRYEQSQQQNQGYSLRLSYTSEYPAFLHLDR